MNKEIEIPEGYEARIEGNKVIFEPKKSEDERIRKEIIDYFYGCIKRNKKSGFRVEQIKGWIAYLEKQKEDKDELVYHLNGLMQDFYKAGKDEDEQEHRFKCYKLFWDALEDAEFFEQKEQKPERVNITEMVAKYRATDEYVEGKYKGKPIYCMIRAYEQGIRDTLLKVKEQKSIEWSKEYREEDLRTRFAFYTYKDEDGVLYLSNVFVEEASRNKGFGTRILNAAEMVAKTIGAKIIRLKVKQDSPANAWYRKNGYGYMTFENGYDWLEKNLECMKPSKPSEWSEEDEANLDYLIDFCNSYYNGNTRTLTESMARTLSTWLYRIKSGEISLPKSRLDEKDEKIIHLACEFIRHHATKGDSIGGINCSELINRLKSLRPQPKQEWSEEDVERLAKNRAFKSGTLKSEMIFYRQGVRDAFNYKGMRPHWKPSEEQMAALAAAKIGVDTDHELLELLYNDLKKL